MRQPKQRDPAAAQRQQPEPALIAADLPFTISLETAGGVATPLIPKGRRLPATASEIFSTYEDNQSVATVQLFVGERQHAKDNVPVGTFELRDIPPAPRGQPQIVIKATVDRGLILTVSAENQSTGQQEVLDAVDLTQVELSEELGGDSTGTAKTTESLRDSPVDFSQKAPAAGSGEEGGQNIFSEFFGDAFGSFKNFPFDNLDREMQLILSTAEARAGTERVIDTGNGKRISVKVPAGMKPAQKLRLRGPRASRR